MRLSSLLGIVAVALLVAGCEGITYQQGGSSFVSAPAATASSPRSRVTSQSRSSHSRFAIVAPSTAALAASTAAEVLINKGYIMLPEHVAPRLLANGSAQEVTVARCVDRGERVKPLLGTSRVVHCTLYEVNSDEVVYTGQGEHIDWSVELDFRGAVRAALHDLPAVGSVGRHASSADISAALKPKVAAGPSKPRPGELAGTGSGFIASIRGHVVTNAHVVDGCGSLQADLDGRQMPLRLIATDSRSDLAVLSLPEGRYRAAVLLSGDDIALGSEVVVLGFPLHGLIAESLNVTRGNVSSLAGLNNDLTTIQITAPVQPGNSGGPVLDENGIVVAVVTSKLSEAATIRAGAGLPQNVNFAVRAGLVRLLLRSQGVRFDSSAIGGAPLSTSELASRGSNFTVRIRCLG